MQPLHIHVVFLNLTQLNFEGDYISLYNLKYFWDTNSRNEINFTGDLWAAVEQGVYGEKKRTYN